MEDDVDKSVYQFIPEETDATKLAEMLRVYGRLYMALDGFWHRGLPAFSSMLSFPVHVHQLLVQFESSRSALGSILIRSWGRYSNTSTSDTVCSPWIPTSVGDL